MRYLFSPNLPQTDVKLVAITSNEPALQEAFQRLDIDTIMVYPNSTLDPAISSHPDMLLHPLNGRELLLAEKGICDEEKLLFYGFQLHYLSEKLQKKYPRDSVLNVARVGSIAFGNFKNAAPDLIQYYAHSAVKTVSVAQGYAKCNTCILTENSIVTSDSSIQKAALAHGFDVLKLPAGGIRLEGYDTGFIGGCCGLIGRNRMAIYGNAEKLPYYDILHQFAMEREVEIISLCKEQPVTDVGSIIPLGCIGDE